MYKVWFGEEPKTAKCIAESDTRKGAGLSMYQYLQNLGITPPYWRSWKNDDGYEVLDFGSWTQFFYVETIGTPTEERNDA